MIVKSQVEIRGSNIDQAKDLLKKVANCKSQILSYNLVFLIYLIQESIRLNLLIKPVYITLKIKPMKKLNKKYAELLHQASIATGRKEAVGLLHKAAKLQNKLDSNSEN